MSDEKQNKPGWRNDLLQWERSAAGAASEKDMLWNKLHERLRSPRKTNKKFLFPIAASVILLFFVSVFVFQKNGKNTTEESFTKKTTSAKSNQPASLIKNNNVAVVNMIEEKRTIKKTGNPAKKTAVKAIIVNPSIIKNEMPAIDSVKEMIVEKKENADPLKNIVSAVPQKKRLRVVHMNELNKPQPPTYATLREEWKQQWLELMPQEKTEVISRSIWPGKNKN